MLAYLFLVVAVAVRFLPHAWSFTPVGAALLFFGSRQPRKQMWAPLLLMVTADVVLTRVVNGYPIGWEALASAAYYAMALGLGWLLREKHNVARIAAASLTGSIAFFLISNLATFVQYDIYPHTWSGLATCYAMGVPFFRNSVAGDLLYALAMFATPAMVSLLHQSRGKNSIAA